MSARLRRIAQVWVSVAVLLAVLSFAGGDASIVAGWLFLAWTIPFGVLWWFYLYDAALQWLPAQVAQLTGTVLVVGISFLFWFVLVPKVNKMFRRNASS